MTALYRELVIAIAIAIGTSGLCAIHKPLRDNSIKYYIICWIERLCSMLMSCMLLFFLFVVVQATVAAIEE